MHNNDFDIHPISVHYSVNRLNIQKMPKNKVLFVQNELGVRIFI